MPNLNNDKHFYGRKHYRGKSGFIYKELKLEIKKVGLGIIWYAHRSQLGPDWIKRNLYRSGEKECFQHCKEKDEPKKKLHTRVVTV